ncbi:hypothetical protein LSH36_427g02021 [Paralvinella palmiformis]|uniref:YitH/HolE acetyltransferase (GNAT) domain-containing protein n=1 Tax=Paralvinella palmiformis TaxID=53620 RepID=A0AAD9MYD0_9ANNE|nr:hypothetical protein LSH36_427g02021 [Paralvinella palmiformis]
MSEGHDIIGPEVFKTYNDGYIGRAMTGHGLYSGEYEVNVVAFWVQIPWGNGVYYDSYYYVHEDYRGKGASSIPFDELISFDNKISCQKTTPERKKFLGEWINIPDCAHFVALDDRGRIVGFGQRRPAIQAKCHLIGTLSVNDTNTTLPILQLQRHCQYITRKKLQLISGKVLIAKRKGMEAIESRGFERSFDVRRMYANGNPEEFKPTVPEIDYRTIYSQKQQ